MSVREFALACIGSGQAKLPLRLLSQAIARIERIGPYCVMETGGK